MLPNNWYVEYFIETRYNHYFKTISEYMTGILSSYMSKLHKKDRNASVLVMSSFSFLLQGLQQPHTLYRASKAFRLFSSHFGQELIQNSELVFNLIAIFNNLRAVDSAPLRFQCEQVLENDLCGCNLDKDNDFDVLLECKKNLVYGICQIIKFANEEYASTFLTALIQPLLQFLQLELQSQSYNKYNDICGVVDMIALFVRSVRRPSGSESSSSSVSMESYREEYRQHPAVQLLISSGSVFRYIDEEWLQHLLQNVMLALITALTFLYFILYIGM